jgi:hypothetical protein
MSALEDLEKQREAQEKLAEFQRKRNMIPLYNRQNQPAVSYEKVLIFLHAIIGNTSVSSEAIVRAIDRVGHLVAELDFGDDNDVVAVASDASFKLAKHIVETYLLAPVPAPPEED